MELFFATSNEAKLKRFNKLECQGIKILGLKDVNVDIDIDPNKI